MIVRTIAQDSRAYTGRKCPVCLKVCRPGQTVVQDRGWVAHRKCMMVMLIASYRDLPDDGEPVNHSTRESRDTAAAQRAEAKRQAEAAEFDAYRQELLARTT